jgi:hypothetical protein
MKEEEGKENNSQLSQPHTGLSEPGARGVPDFGFWQISKLYSNKDADYAHPITSPPPPLEFSDLPTALHIAYTLCSSNIKEDRKLLRKCDRAPVINF